MTHWGWYWKIKQQHAAKQLCEDQTQIDSFMIAKQPGFCAFRDISPCIVSYRDQTQTIDLLRLPCRYGGYRYYFSCGSCQHRKRFLYWNNSFACRSCLNLCYRVQREQASERTLSAICKIERRLQRAGGSRDRRPLGMHNRTWDSLHRKLTDYELSYQRALRNELLARYPRHTTEIYALL